MQAGRPLVGVEVSIAGPPVVPRRLLMRISACRSLWAAGIGYGHQRLQPNRTPGDAHDTDLARVVCFSAIATTSSIGSRGANAVHTRRGGESVSLLPTLNYAIVGDKPRSCRHQGMPPSDTPRNKINLGQAALAQDFMNRVPASTQMEGSAV
jgi:hypothetical protein